MQVDRPRRPGGRPHRPQSTQADRTADIVINLVGRLVPRPCPRRRGALGRRRVGAPARPGGLHDRRPPLGGGRRAPRDSGGFAPVSVRPSFSARCRTRSSSGSSSRPPRRPPSSPRGRGGRRRQRATRSCRGGHHLALGSGQSRRCPSRSGRHEPPDRPASPAGASDPALLRRAGPQLPARGARAHLDGRRCRPRDHRPHRAGILPRGRGRRPAAVPQQPRPRRRVRGARVPRPGRIHRAAGEVLEGISTDLDADSPTLVLHFARAGDGPRTWRYAQMAGELARRSYANADAADHFETALETSTRVPDVTDHDRAELWSRVGELRELAGMFEASLDAYRRAARLLRDDPVARAEVLDRQATVHTRTGELRTAMRVVGRARRVLDGADGAGSGTSSASTVSPRGSASSRSAWGTRKRGRRRLGRGPRDRRPRQPRAGPDLPRHGRAAHGRPRPRRAPPRGARDLHRGGLSAARGDRAREPRHARLLRGALDRGGGVVLDPREAAIEVGKDFGAAETAVDLAELLINQAGSTRRIVCSRMPCASCARRARSRSWPRARSSWRGSTSCGATTRRGGARGRRGRAAARPGQDDDGARGLPRAGRRDDPRGPARARADDDRRGGARGEHRGGLHCPASACSARGRCWPSVGSPRRRSSSRPAFSRPARPSCPTTRRCCSACSAGCGGTRATTTAASGPGTTPRRCWRRWVRERSSTHLATPASPSSPSCASPRHRRCRRCRWPTCSCRRSCPSRPRSGRRTARPRRAVGRTDEVARLSNQLGSQASGMKKRRVAVEVYPDGRHGVAL